MRRLFAGMVCGLLATSPLLAQVQDTPQEKRLRPDSSLERPNTADNQLNEKEPVPQRDARQRVVDQQKRDAQVIGRNAEFRTGEAANSDASVQATEVLAAWLMTCNKAEIELTQFAAEKASNQEVKQFAQTLHDEHQKLQTKLQEFAGEAGQKWNAGTTDSQNPESRTTDRANATQRPGVAERTARRTETETRRRGTNASDEAQNDDEPQTGTSRQRDQDGPITRRANRIPTTGELTDDGTHGSHLLAQVGQQATQNSVQMTKELMQEKSGQEFDMCFLGGQIVAHIHMIGTMKAMQSHASGEFAQVLDQGIQSTQQHYAKAKELASKITDQDDNR